MLDPHVSYERLKKDSQNDVDLSSGLKIAMSQLTSKYCLYYAPAPGQSSNRASVNVALGSPSTRDYMNDSDEEDQEEQDVDAELKYYFRITEKPEPTKSTDVLEWWYMHRHQMPNLYRLARDVFGIPGELSCIPVFIPLMEPL